MITSVSTQGLRGIREGRLEGLSPVSIILGPNNAGKSTCLEAIAILGLGTQADAIAEVLLRRGGPPHDAMEHVLSHGMRSVSLEAHGSFADQPASWRTALEVDVDRLSPGEVAGLGLEGLSLCSLPVSTQVQQTGRTEHRNGHGLIDERGHVRLWKGDITPHLPSSPVPSFPVKLVDVEAVRAGGALEDAYSRIERAGQVEKVVRALQPSMPGLTDLRILKSGPHFLLHTFLGKGAPVPAYLAGDGFKRFLELASASLDVERGVVLLEEPESYQHPRYLRELASLLLQAVRAGTQVILSTHSIELVDLLLHAPEAESLPYPTVHRLRLTEGRLSAVTLQRDQALTLRDELLEDLRS